MHRTEILNGLDAILETLYEFGAYDAEYYENVIGEAQDIVMEYDLGIIPSRIISPCATGIKPASYMP